MKRYRVIVFDAVAISHFQSGKLKKRKKDMVGFEDKCLSLVC